MVRAGVTVIAVIIARTTFDDFHSNGVGGIFIVHEYEIVSTTWSQCRVTSKQLNRDEVEPKWDVKVCVRCVRHSVLFHAVNGIANIIRASPEGYVPDGYGHCDRCSSCTLWN